MNERSEIGNGEPRKSVSRWHATREECLGLPRGLPGPPHSLDEVCHVLVFTMVPQLSNMLALEGAE